MSFVSYVRPVIGCKSIDIFRAEDINTTWELADTSISYSGVWETVDLSSSVQKGSRLARMHCYLRTSSSGNAILLMREGGSSETHVFKTRKIGFEGFGATDYIFTELDILLGEDRTFDYTGYPSSVYAPLEVYMFLKGFN